jgi:hypothetical protein
VPRVERLLRIDFVLGPKKGNIYVTLLAEYGEKSCPPKGFILIYFKGINTLSKH